MNKENKQRLLDAFDALSRIESGRFSDGGRKNSHGGSASCDFCGLSLASGGNPACPVESASKLLVPLLPTFYDRQKWLDAPGQAEQEKSLRCVCGCVATIHWADNDRPGDGPYCHGCVECVEYRQAEKESPAEEPK